MSAGGTCTVCKKTYPEKCTCGRSKSVVITDWLKASPEPEPSLEVSEENMHPAAKIDSLLAQWDSKMQSNAASPDFSEAAIEFAQSVIELVDTETDFRVLDHVRAWSREMSQMFSRSESKCDAWMHPDRAKGLSSIAKWFADLRQRVDISEISGLVGVILSALE